MGLAVNANKTLEPIKEVDRQPDEPKCRVCRELIQPGARICPHCRSSQSRRRWWHYTVVALKWVGGATAVLSLVALSIQLTEIVQNSLKTRVSVGQLVKVAGLLRAKNDLTGAQEMLDQALRLDPGDFSAHQLQVQIAMQQIRRNVYYSLAGGETEWDAEVKPLILKIRRGIGHRDPRFAADVYAHLGWAYSLLSARQPSIMNFYEEALALDPDNVFANAFWGGTCLRIFKGLGDPCKACGEDPLETACHHFRLALAQKREHTLIQQIAFSNLLWRSMSTGTQGAIEALVLAKDFLKKGSDGAHKYGWELLQDLHAAMDHGRKEAALLRRFSAAELLKLVQTIAPDPQDNHYMDDIVVARLIGLQGGDTQKLVERLKQLRARVHVSKHEPQQSGITIDHYINKSIVLALKLKTASMGIRVDMDAKKSDVPDPRGARIIQVTANGPADQAGLQRGDIIVAVGDLPVTSGRRLFDYIDPLQPGEKIMLTFFRKNSEKRIAVTLGPGGNPLKKRYLHRFVNRYLYHSVEAYTHYWPPLQLAELSQELRSAYNISNNVQGAIVLQPHQNLKAGDVLTEVDSQKIRQPEDVQWAIRTAKNTGLSLVSITLSRPDGIKTTILELRRLSPST